MSTVYEGEAAYCSAIKSRISTALSNVTVRCPEIFAPSVMFGADVYYTWINPPRAWDLLHVLRQGVRDGTVGRTAVFATICFPVSHYRRVGDNAIHIWRGVQMASLASRVTLVPFRELSRITVRGGDSRVVDEKVAFLEFDLADDRWDEITDLVSWSCSGRYTPQRCPVPYELSGAPLASV
jgi:hypothetical protein